MPNLATTQGPEEVRAWVAPGEPIISVRGVTKSFGSHTVLEDITFDVPKGRITAILGPSGTGKSVLLKNILGLLRPQRGEIWVDGDQIVGLREKRLYEVRRKFGVLFQDGALFGSMNLYDNIAFPLREHTRKNEREIREIVMRNAELVGLLDHMKKLPGEVSGGMKKRAGLARAMVTEPEIVLFDEPDSGLDPVRVAYLDDLVLTAQKETGATFFIITHNIQSVMRTADYLGVLFRSNLVKFGSKEEMTTTDNQIIRQFLAGRPDGPIGMDEMADGDDRAGRSGAAPSTVPAGPWDHGIPDASSGAAPHVPTADPPTVPGPGPTGPVPPPPVGYSPLPGQPAPVTGMPGAPGAPAGRAARRLPPPPPAPSAPGPQESSPAPASRQRAWVPPAPGSPGNGAGATGSRPG
jgi:phospholipid/cholesterol/gamma-HCH transport system ATP-binding protein